MAIRLVVAGLACVAALAGPARADEDITAGGADVRHQGAAVFTVALPGAPQGGPATPVRRVDLRAVGHGYDPAVDPDVPLRTDITRGPAVADMVDARGREYALITLYQIDPPLADIASSVEPGIHRGIDMRSPADMVKSAYSNYVSAVVTDDAEQRPVPGHPIGHFFVKVEIPGYPTILTGMTTIQRSDRELVDLTLGRGLGLGGVLLTPQPGRLNAAAEVVDELQLRQRRLRVIDGRFFKQRHDGENAGPEYVIEDGNVVFARFRLPRANALDALAVFVEFVAREQHRIFGSLINRPHKGTGAGCTPFAMSWLKASGVIPFVAEPEAPRRVDAADPVPVQLPALWAYLLRTSWVPWPMIGCDSRVGIDRTQPAGFTVYDHLFHAETDRDLIAALPGLAEKIRRDRGAVVSTLFAFGALTPLRDLFIASRRNDPADTGDYAWAPTGHGLRARFWDNGRFSAWVKHLWRTQDLPEEFALVREGRFKGVEIDAMDTPRQTAAYFRDADRNAARIVGLGGRVAASQSCREVFAYGLQ